jgi:acyl dehydratase
VVAPPTFPIVIQEKTLHQLLNHPDVGIDFTRVVHGDQKFEYSRPVVAGDELIATLRVVKVQSLGGHSMVTTESVMTTPEGEHVVTATSTLVVRADEDHS